MTNFYQIYTDGSCAGNPGPGGAAAIILHPDGSESEHTLAEHNSTNNRMELLGPIIGLQNCPFGDVVIYSDSKYVVDGMTSWIKKWKKNGWKASGKPVKNQDLWIKLDELASKRNVEFKWVRGHNGHPMNERADKLANKAYSLQSILPSPASDDEYVEGFDLLDIFAVELPND